MENNVKKWEPIDFTVYISFIKWPLLLAIVVEILFRIWTTKLGEGIFFDNRELIVWFLRIAVFVFAGWRLVKTFGFNKPIAAVAGVLTGVGLGIVISIYRFFEGFRVWKIFNILTETTIITIVCVLILILMVYVMGIASKE